MIQVAVYPAPILLTPAEPVTEFNGDLQALVQRLRDAAQERSGMGMAAPQLGVSLSVFVLRDWPQPFINPELIGHSEAVRTMPEGCFSVRETLRGNHTTRELGLRIPRWTKVKLRSANLKGVVRVTKHNGMDARAVQHELDHLDGILITDRLGGGVG